MSKYATTFGLHMPLAQRKTGQRNCVNRKWFLIPLLGMIFFGISYVFIVNHTSSQGYQLRAVEKRISQLQSETKKLELNVAGLQSMGSIGLRLAESEFVSVAQVKYLKAGAPAVALK